MRKVLCSGEKQHFYDADVSTRCPHCGAPEAKEEKPVGTEEKEGASTEKKHGLFGGWKKSKEIHDIKISKLPKDSQSVKPAPAEIEENGYISERRSENGVQITRPIWDIEEDEPEQEEIESEESSAKPRKKRDIDDVKTTTIYGKKAGVEPVTGWLVCIKGEHYGESFEVKAGQNSIGRDSSMDICLKKEGSVTREKHAYIIFEPKKRQFLLRGGDGKGLTYCNEELVKNVILLNAYDELQLGEAYFLFVPFCNEQFMWDKTEQ